MVEELKRYVGFGEEDARLLARMRPLVSPHFPRIAQEFYEKIREHEEAHAVFTGEPQIARLQTSLVRWLERAFTGPYDSRYAEETANIGRVHVKVGLPQRYMFSAMALIQNALERIADASMGTDAGGARAAITKLLHIELATMLEAYRDDWVSRIQRVERQETADLRGALQRTEHRYVNAVEFAKVIMVGLDASGNVQMFNREAERVSGFGRDEVLGRPFLEALLPESLRTEHGGVFVRAAKSGAIESGVVESVIRAKSGKIRHVRWQLSHAPSQSTDEIVLFALGQDTTEENARAERQRQQEKLAAVGTLAAGLAHEIRNPLNGAQLHVAFLERALKRTQTDEDTLDAVKIVGEEIKRLSNLVSEFLDFARPKPLLRKPVSLRELCERSVQLAGADAQHAQVEVTSDLPTRDIGLDADGSKLAQVLLNLLQNAIEALAPTGGGQVTLRARRQPRFAIIEVEDDGPGLPSPNAPIFDAFFSTKPNGTGLGLAIAHRIVTDHGGTIDVESRPGRTLFRLTLPVDLSMDSVASR